MGNISQELTKFKDDVSGKTEAMNSMCDTITTKLSSLESACASTSSDIDAHYKSEMKAQVLSAFSVTSQMYQKIKESIDGVLRPMISSASSLVDEIIALEKIEQQIKDQQLIVNNNSGDSEAAVKARTSAREAINKLTNDLNEGNQKALDSLSALKGMDGSIDLGIADNASAAGKDDIIIDGGTLSKQSFTASNGKNVTYYLYLPKVVGDSNEKLPILTYFHGIQDTIERNEGNNFKYGGGLAGLIERGLLNPKGIIIFPQATDGTVDHDFITKPYQEAIIELIKATAEKYNGDLSRASIAGHSNGGAAAQHIVNNYPGFFAATALMGISSNAQQGIAQTNLYALVGNTDHTMDSPGRAISYAKNHNQLYKVYNMGHDIQTIAFQEPVHDENGNSVMLVDWLMSKTLA